MDDILFYVFQEATQAELSSTNSTFDEFTPFFNSQAFEDIDQEEVRLALYNDMFGGLAWPGRDEKEVRGWHFEKGEEEINTAVQEPKRMSSIGSRRINLCPKASPTSSSPKIHEGAEKLTHFDPHAQCDKTQSLNKMVIIFDIVDDGHGTSKELACKRSSKGFRCCDADQKGSFGANSIWRKRIDRAGARIMWSLLRYFGRKDRIAVLMECDMASFLNLASKPSLPQTGSVAFQRLGFSSFQSRFT
ncbi:Eukaryotic translation initiation factor 3 subunit C [Venturia nashicola]|uniref:Eukaryotic translation initiation factor 3 subunit C n=1 Tax=Venturia nashicola TaxID=86259 RepID=A0A4Z1P6Z2_9PEZI|nr:Eukaryotic translation initiation factor 3 subunit C [Venturia nashicola]